LQKDRDMYTVFITDHSFTDTAPEREILTGLARVVDLSGSPPRTEEEVISACRGADALIVGFAPVTARVLDALPGLKGIVRYGIGCDTIDLPAAAARGLPVANVPDYCIEEVSDHTLALVLALERRILAYDVSTREGQWKPVTTERRIHRLVGRRLGIIGFGRIGREVARRARVFGYRIFAFDPYLSETAVREGGAEPAGLDELLASADVTTLHLPLTGETRGLIGREKLAIMKNGAFLVNVARGALVDGDALAEALTVGRLAGAALDVYETEPLPPGHPLRSAPNTILQPHCAWYSEESLRNLQKSAAMEAARILRGEPLRNPVL